MLWKIVGRVTVGNLRGAVEEEDEVGLMGSDLALWMSTTRIDGSSRTATRPPNNPCMRRTVGGALTIGHAVCVSAHAVVGFAGAASAAVGDVPTSQGSSVTSQSRGGSSGSGGPGGSIRLVVARASKALAMRSVDLAMRQSW